MINKLEKLRKMVNLNQEDVAKVLGISRQTYSRIEKGEVELTLGQSVKLSKLLDIEVAEFFGEDMMVNLSTSTDWDKYKQIILNCIKFGSDSDGKITKTKLAKLCYLVDFGWFYDNLNSLTGLSYRRIQQGPVPDAYFAMIDELKDEESIDVNLTHSGAYMIENLGTPSYNRLNSDELEFIKSICEKWKGKNTQEIVEFTHNQLPWKICKERELIPYELITQEEPENVY